MPIDETLDTRVARLEEALQYERGRRERLEARQRRWTRAAKLGAAAILAIGTLSYGVRAALAAGNCNQTLPMPLTTFCAGTPALASEINGDFQGVVDKLVSKVGAWGSVDATMNAVTMKSAQVNGNLTATGTAQINGSATVGGDVKITGKALVGYHVVKCKGMGICDCPAGEVLLGGGASCNNGSLTFSSVNPFNATGWAANCTQNPPDTVAYCARLGL